MKSIVSAMLLSLISISAWSQAKVPVYLIGSHGEQDNLGQRLAFELKEQILTSARFRLVEDEKSWPYLKVYIITVVGGEAGLSTAVNYTIVFDSKEQPLRGALIAGGVRFCGRNRVTDCARDLLPTIDRAVDSLQKEAPSLWSALR